MPALSVILEGDGAWPDLVDKGADLIWLGDTHIQVAALAMGMASGRASVAIRVDLPDGRTVVAETSLALFLGAARAFQARHGDQAEPPGTR